MSKKDKTDGKFYTFWVDGQEYHIDKAEITGAEIMDMAGILYSVGLMLIEEDGNQKQIYENDVVDLVPGRRYKKAPRFKRG